jgi:hypothetical protein
MRHKLQKQSALKFAGRINESQVSEAKRAETCWTNYPLCKTHMDIPQSGGFNTPQLAAESVSKACFGVNTRD